MHSGKSSWCDLEDSIAIQEIAEDVDAALGVPRI